MRAGGRAACRSMPGRGQLNPAARRQIGRVARGRRIFLRGCGPTPAGPRHGMMPKPPLAEARSAPERMPNPPAQRPAMRNCALAGPAAPAGGDIPDPSSRSLKAPASCRSARSCGWRCKVGRGAGRRMFSQTPRRQSRTRNNGTAFQPRRRFAARPIADRELHTGSAP